MNEQLVVKNFGPIKDATVDFKRVTVFIGPTGGGKSTLAKLAAIFNTDLYATQANGELRKFACLNDYNLFAFQRHFSEVSFSYKNIDKFISFEQGQVVIYIDDDSHDLQISGLERSRELAEKAKKLLEELTPITSGNDRTVIIENVKKVIDEASEVRTSAFKIVKKTAYDSSPFYIPSDRAFLTSINSSFAGLMRDDIGLPKPLLNFANAYFQARDEVHGLKIDFLNIKYFRHDSKDYISFAAKEPALELRETASGIQSVTPLLVLLEHLSRNTEQAQSFIIEEPELNLYPTAQQGLLNWLVEKCTKGENDLTITTHSPYILSHLNLLLYAYQVADKHPDRADEVAKLVPRESWINPAEFACYQVENGGVTSLVNAELGLIDDNGLDNLSGDAADAFDNLIRLSKAIALK